MNPIQELLNIAGRDNNQQRIHEVLTRVAGLDAFALNNCFPDAINAFCSCLSQIQLQVSCRVLIFRSLSLLLSLCSGQQLLNQITKPLWKLINSHANQSLQYVENAVNSVSNNYSINSEELLEVLEEQSARVMIYHTLADRIKELFTEIPLNELQFAFSSLFDLFCGSMFKIQDFSPILAMNNLQELAGKNDNTRDMTAQLYVKVFKMISSSQLAFDPNYSAELVLVCDGILSVCGVSEKRNFSIINAGWGCLKELFSKYTLQLRNGNLNVSNVVKHILDKIHPGLDEFIASAPVEDLQEPKYKKGSTLVRFYLPQLRLVCSTFGNDINPSLGNILDLIIKIKSCLPPSILHYNTPLQITKEINVMSYQADLLFENVIPNVQDISAFVQKLDPSNASVEKKSTDSLGKMCLINLLLLHCDKSHLDPQIVSQCVWWLLEYMPYNFPELCTSIAPARIGKDSEAPRLSLFEEVLSSVLHFFGAYPQLGVDIQLFIWECIAHPFNLCSQLGIEVAAYSLKFGDDDFVNQNLSLFLEWIVTEKFDPSAENSTIGNNILHILAKAAPQLSHNQRGLITSKLLLPVESYALQDDPFPTTVCAYCDYMRLTNFAYAPNELINNILPMCVSKINFWLSNSSANSLNGVVFVLRAIFMDKNYAKQHVPTPHAHNISQATVQLLSKRDTYPAHLPDIIDLAASLLTDYFNTQQRENVVGSITDIIDTTFNKDIALSVADLLGNFNGLKIEISWAENIKNIFHKLFATDDDSVILEALRNYFALLEFNPSKDLLPKFLPEFMRGQMRSFIVFIKSTRGNPISTTQMCDITSLVTQKEVLLSVLQPLLAKRQRINRNSVLVSPPSANHSNQQQNGIKRNKTREEIRKIAQTMRGALTSMRPYVEDITKEDAEFILEEIKDIGVSFFSMEDILKSAHM